MSANQKLKFYWRDKNPMVLVGLLSYAGIKYGDLPGNAPGVIVWGRDVYISVYLKNKAWKDNIQSGKKLMNKNYAEKYFKKSKAFRKRYDDFILQTRQLDYKNLSDKEIIGFLKQLWNFELEGTALYWGSQLEPLILAEKRLRDILKRFYPIEEIEKIMQTIIAPITNDKAQQQEIDWVKIVASKNKLSKNDFFKHGWKYPFLFRNNYNIETSCKYFKNKFLGDKTRLNQLQKELFKIEEKKVKLEQEQKAVFKKINKEGEYLAKLFQKSAIERMELKYTWAGAEEFTFHDLYKETAKRIGEDFIRMINYYCPGEIIKSIKGKQKLSEVEVERRKKAFLYDVEKDKVLFFSGDKAIKRVKSRYPELVLLNQENSVKGTIANMGKAIGEVVIVATEDLVSLAKWNKDFKKGQILIAGMTQPNMISLMRKAGAIVTDEGGLTSHAAIISREFGKPCIVGTHKATEIFKNGDLVEVDANKGIVIKIKNNKYSKK